MVHQAEQLPELTKYVSHPRGCEGFADHCRVWQPREPFPASTVSDDSQHRERFLTAMTSPGSPPLKRKRGVRDLTQLHTENLYEQNPFTPPNSQSYPWEADDEFTVRPAKRLEFEIGPLDVLPSSGSDCSRDYDYVSDHENSDADEALDTPSDLVAGLGSSLVQPPVLYCTWEYRPMLPIWELGKNSSRGRQKNRTTKDNNNKNADKNNAGKKGRARKEDDIDREYKKKKREKEQDKKDWAEAKDRAGGHWICVSISNPRNGASSF